MNTGMHFDCPDVGAGDGKDGVEALLIVIEEEGRTGPGQQPTVGQFTHFWQSSDVAQTSA